MQKEKDYILIDVNKINKKKIGQDYLEYCKKNIKKLDDENNY
jgi:hypothetical protein